jgi:hypothetical protein
MKGMAHELHETYKVLGELSVVIWLYHDIIINITVIIISRIILTLFKPRGSYQLAATFIYV